MKLSGPHSVLSRFGKTLGQLRLPASRSRSAISRSCITPVAISNWPMSFIANRFTVGEAIGQPSQDYRNCGRKLCVTSCDRWAKNARPPASSPGTKASRSLTKAPARGIALALHRAVSNLEPRWHHAHVAEWQTRAAQDRMGKPVEVRLLS